MIKILYAKLAISLGVTFTGSIIHLSLSVVPLREDATAGNVPIRCAPRIVHVSYDIWLIVLSVQIINIKKIHETS